MSDKHIYQIKTPTITTATTTQVIRETRTYHPLGYWSIDPLLTGGMSATVSYSVSNTGDFWSVPTDIVTGAVAGQSNFSAFEPSLATYIRFTVETAGAGTCDLNVVTQ